MPQSESASILERMLPFWDQLSRTQKDTLTANAKPARFTAGQLIHRGERECIGILAVTEGTLRVYITSDEGREIPLYRLQKNSVCILSAACILEHIDFEVSIEAESDCSALIVNSAAFARVSAQNVYAELYAYKLAAERFSDVMWALQQLLFTRFDKRLADFLLAECERTGSSILRITHEHIAKQLGTAREVVSRMLKYFESEDWLSLSRGSIAVNDAAALGSAVTENRS